MTPTDLALQTELEAAAFRKLVAHLRERTDVQNIDLMNLAGFCRNCLARWLEEAAADHGSPMSRSDARVQIYGMAYEEWRSLHQRDATVSQQNEFERGAPHRHG